MAKRLLIGDGGQAGEAGAMVAKAVNAALDGIDQFTLSLDENREQIASTVAGSLDELDTVSLGRILNRLLLLGNAVRRKRRVSLRRRLEAVLSQLEVGELLSAVGGALKNCATTGWTVLSWAVRSIVRNR